jgi:hypothetical protein
MCRDKDVDEEEHRHIGLIVSVCPYARVSTQEQLDGF